jgi:hypothetical protein
MPSRIAIAMVNMAMVGYFYPIQEKSYKTTIYRDKLLQTISYHGIT